MNEKINQSYQKESKVCLSGAVIRVHILLICDVS